MKCAVCGKEFGDGDNCQYCGTDRVSGLGRYDGYAPKNSVNNKQTSSSIQNSPKHSTDSGYTICYKCAETIPAGSFYCPKCGIKLIVECPKCGHAYSSQYPICNQCGTDREKYIAQEKQLAILHAIEEKRRKDEEERKKAEQARLAEARRAEELRRKEAERLRQEERRREEEAAMKAKQEAECRRLQRERKIEQAITSTDCYKEALRYIIQLCNEMKSPKVFDRLSISSCCVIGLYILLVVGSIATWYSNDAISVIGYMANYCNIPPMGLFVIALAIILIAMMIIMAFLWESDILYACGVFLLGFGAWSLVYQICGENPLSLETCWWIIICAHAITVIIFGIIAFKKRYIMNVSKNSRNKWLKQYLAKHNTFKDNNSKRIVEDFVSDIIYDKIKIQKIIHDESAIKANLICAYRQRIGTPIEINR